MSASELPPLQPIGPTWATVRKEMGLRQIDVGEMLGWGKRAQSAMSNREQPPDSPAATEPSHDELVRFEDHYGLKRGTVLRRAGYVVDATDPLDTIDSWSFLDPTERRIIRGVVEQAWNRAGRPGSAPRAPRSRGE